MRKANSGDLADDTIAARLTHVQGLFRWAYIHGATPLTPDMVKGFIPKPRIKQLSPRNILDASEVGAMLRVTKSAEDPTQAKRGHALIRVMADAGLRVSEAVNLKADDVYLADGKKNQAILDWDKSKAALIRAACLGSVKRRFYITDAR